MDTSKVNLNALNPEQDPIDQLHQLFDTQPDALLLVDHEVKLSASQKICGYGRHQMAGVIPLDIVVNYIQIKDQTFTLFSIGKKEYCDSNQATLPHQSLSKREFEVFKLIAVGRSIKEIAQDLKISEKTVATHLARLREKTGLLSYVQIARYALLNGLVG